MKSSIFRWLGILLILETGLIHYFTAQRQYEEAAYFGYLFIVYALGTLIAAFGIFHKQTWGWALGFVLSVASLAVFFLSRTLGLPGLPIQEWLVPLEIVPASAEFAFILLCLFRPWKVQPSVLQPVLNIRLGYFLPITSLLMVPLIGVLAFLWDGVVTREYGHHVRALDSVCRTPMTSLDELQERYGIQVSLVAISMLDTIVDVRIRVVDPDKAGALLNNQAALLVDQKVLILAPHQHHHGTVRRDKIHFIFFPTQNNTVHAGSEVSLVFGPIRVEPIDLK